MDSDTSASMSSSVQCTVVDSRANRNEPMSRSYARMCARRIQQHSKGDYQRVLPDIVSSTPMDVRDIKATFYIPSKQMTVGEAARLRLIQATRGRTPAALRPTIPPHPYISVYDIVTRSNKKARSRGQKQGKSGSTNQ